MNSKIVLYLLLHLDFRNTNAIKIENLQVLYIAVKFRIYIRGSAIGVEREMVY